MAGNQDFPAIAQPMRVGRKPTLVQVEREWLLSRIPAKKVPFRTLPVR
jgi:hypothetical protein